MGAIEAHSGVRRFRSAKEGVGYNSTGERTLDRLLDAARRDRIDSQRSVTQPDRIRVDAIRQKVGSRVDRPHWPYEFGAIAIRQEAGARDQLQESLCERARRCPK